MLAGRRLLVSGSRQLSLRPLCSIAVSLFLRGAVRNCGRIEPRINLGLALIAK